MSKSVTGDSIFCRLACYISKMQMKNSKLLALCPPNMTVPVGGPNGFIGDRVHQLAAIRAGVRMYGCVHVWPCDRAARAILTIRGADFISAECPDDVAAAAIRLGVDTVLCLYREPVDIPSGRQKDCLLVSQCEQVVGLLRPHMKNIRRPEELDPKGNVFLWKRFLDVVCPETSGAGAVPTMPILVPDGEAVSWATEFLGSISPGGGVLVVSALSGTPRAPGGADASRTVNDEWWRRLAGLFSGPIIVPVPENDVPRAQAIFEGHSNVRIVATSIMQTAALAAAPGTRILGIDGGGFNLLASACPRKVVGLYGVWPASAWAMPNVMPLDADDVSPPEALSALDRIAPAGAA